MAASESADLISGSFSVTVLEDDLPDLLSGPPKKVDGEQDRK